MIDSLCNLNTIYCIWNFHSFTQKQAIIIVNIIFNLSEMFSVYNVDQPQLHSDYRTKTFLNQLKMIFIVVSAFFECFSYEQEDKYINFIGFIIKQLQVFIINFKIGRIFGNCIKNYSFVSNLIKYDLNS